MSDFEPISTFNKSNADVNLIFIQNHALYHDPVEDPWFHSTMPQNYTNEAGDVIANVFGSSQTSTATTAIGCTEQYEFCNKSVNKCTGLDSFFQISEYELSKEIGLNRHQSLLATHLTWLLKLATLQNLGRILDGSDLLATKYQANVMPKHGWMLTKYGISRKLPPDQWKLEIVHWLRIMTIVLKQSAIDYAAGPTNAIENWEHHVDTHRPQHPELDPCWSRSLANPNTPPGVCLGLL